MFGALVLLLVYYWTARFVQNRGAADISAGCVVFALLAAAMVFPLRWRLRLDQEGVSRRLLFRWDLWSWADLASGRLRKLHPYTLYDPERTWWRRKLGLGHMAPADIREAIATINTHYRLPPPPDVPDALTIKYGFRRSVTLDNQGVHLLFGGTPHEYTWGEVLQVHITRMDPVRRDFTSVRIALPDQEIEWKLFTHQGGTSPEWRGATAEEINEFLFHHVSPDRIDISIAGEPLTKREHIERQLRSTRKRARDFAMMMAIFLPWIVGLLIWMAIDDGVFKAALMAGIFASGPGAVMIFMYRSQREEVETLKRLLESAGEADRHPAGNVPS
jgi:hypothetical protein